MVNIILVKITVNAVVLHAKSKSIFSFYSCVGYLNFNRHSMGNFATLETDENSPIDIQEEGQGGTRRSTRKRKSALHEGLYNTWRYLDFINRMTNYSLSL